MQKKRSLDRSQIIPFPLPEYLAQFISAQLDTPIEIINDTIRAKAMHIRANTPLGKFILRCTEKTDKPTLVKKGLTMYITVSTHAGKHDGKMVEARGTFLTLTEEAIKDITDLFEATFKTQLVEFVDGVMYGNNFKKGKRNKAIATFLEKYNINPSKSDFERFKKMYYREKKQNNLSNKLINKLL